MKTKKNFPLGTDSEPKSKRRLFEGKTHKEGSAEGINERGISEKEARLSGEKHVGSVRDEGQGGNNCTMAKINTSIKT